MKQSRINVNTVNLLRKRTIDLRDKENNVKIKTNK